MSNLLFLDTETTEKWDFHAGPNAEHQPRIVQLAYLITDKDGGELARRSAIFTPDDWTIGPGALATHGITMEHAALVGVAATEVLDELGSWFNLIRRLVCHNIAFDRQLMRREIAMYYRPEAMPFFEAIEAVCTMLAAAPVCKLPKRYARANDPYKWPTLAEACQMILGRPPTSAHNALGDVTDCRDLYFELVRRGAIPV